MSSATRDLLQQIVAPVVTAEGLDLEELEVADASGRKRLRIIVDSDQGVDLDHCAEVSRLISRALDEDDVMGETPYTLEVSSPGVSRPLSRPRHWSRAEGRLVRVRLHDGTELTGRVLVAGAQSALVDVDGTSRTIAYDDVRKAKVHVEFRRDGDDGDDGEEE